MLIHEHRIPGNYAPNIQISGNELKSPCPLLRHLPKWARNVNVNGKRVDAKKTLVGCFIGDHVKTSIGTQIYTGKKIGVASHVHAFITEDVPSFTVWAKSLDAKPVELYLESVIETEKRVFARRGVKQTKEDVDLLKKLFSLTSQERREARVVKKRLEL
jgi:hypothetical protein